MCCYEGGRGGGGMAVRERQIQSRGIAGNCRKLRVIAGKLWVIAGKLWKIAEDRGKIAGKLRENCGAVIKPPEASRSGTSAQGTHRASTSKQGGQAGSNCGKNTKGCEKLRRMRTRAMCVPLHCHNTAFHPRGINPQTVSSTPPGSFCGGNGFVTAASCPPNRFPNRRQPVHQCVPCPPPPPHIQAQACGGHGQRRQEKGPCSNVNSTTGADT